MTTNNVTNFTQFKHMKFAHFGKMFLMFSDQNTLTLTIHLSIIFKIKFKISYIQ